MSGLFIEIYLDEDVDVLIGLMLRARGFEVLTTQEGGAIGSTDEAQLALAVSLGRTLLTHNRVDFERLVQRYFDAASHIAALSSRSAAALRRSCNDCWSSSTA